MDSWSKEEDDLLDFSVDRHLSQFWRGISGDLSNRTVEEVKKRSVVLGLFSPPPREHADSEDHSGHGQKGAVNLGVDSNPSHLERNKRVQWTHAERRNFSVGLKECYSDSRRWKRMSEEYVTTKTPSQIASYAQKYFKRLKLSSSSSNSSESLQQIVNLETPVEASPITVASPAGEASLAMVISPAGEASAQAQGGETSSHPFPLKLTYGSPSCSLALVAVEQVPGGIVERHDDDATAVDTPLTRPDVPQWFHYF